MRSTRKIARVYRALMCLVLLLAGVSRISRAQQYPNTIRFVNQSGENAMVKLIGPIRLSVLVPNAGSSTVNVPGGIYYILTRYCGRQGTCRYSKGDSFNVTQTDTEYSKVEITLHKVAGGQYHTRDASATEFNSQ
jgi:hypothetical protein